MDNKQKVFAYIDAHRDDIVEQLKKMVAVPTINDGDCNGNEGPMQKMFAQQMRDEGFDTVVEAAYDEAGERLRMKVAHVGKAFSAHRKAHPGDELYFEDLHHSSPLGSTVAAREILSVILADEK